MERLKLAALILSIISLTAVVVFSLLPLLHQKEGTKPSFRHRLPVK